MPIINYALQALPILQENHIQGIDVSEPLKQIEQKAEEGVKKLIECINLFATEKLKDFDKKEKEKQNLIAE